MNQIYHCIIKKATSYPIIEHYVTSIILVVCDDYRVY